MKFKAIIFYENQEVLNRYLHNFSYDELIKTYKNDKLIYYEYEHFEIYCYKELYHESFRGRKCDLIAVEKVLTEYDIWNKFKNDISKCMLAPQRFKIDIQMF